MNLPTAAHIANAWPFTNGVVDKSKLGPEVMEADLKTIAPTFDVAQRVLCPATPSAPDAAYRAGGIGTVESISPQAMPGRYLVLVVLDDAEDRTPQPYSPEELAPAPTL